MHGGNIFGSVLTAGGEKKEIRCVNANVCPSICMLFFLGFFGLVFFLCSLRDGDATRKREESRAAAGVALRWACD